MKFGPVPIADAVGALLGHSIALPVGKLKKGHLILDADVEALLASGHEQIIVARLETGDVSENKAAAQIAESLSDDLIYAEKAFTGRSNLYARQPGIFNADISLVNSLNRVDPSITLATLSDGTFVEAGRMVATVKIIPLAVQAAALDAIEKLLSDGDAITIVPSKPYKVGLIATQLSSLKVATMEKTARILSERLATAGSQLICEKRVAHDAAAISAAILEIVDDCDMIILFGASAITDRADVIPAGIELASGAIHSFGMPVDPGNLLLTGALGNVQIIGAPGCARSPAENGFDWVLQRLLAGLPTDESYISGLGVGGLLMEIKARPQPREG